MITKGIITAINRNTSKCSVRLPLFESASSSDRIIIDALINIPPGTYNGYFKGDVVFVSFEENSLDKPVVIGKLYRGASFEKDTPGGMGIYESLVVRNNMSTPAASTHFKFSAAELKELSSKNAKNYRQLDTPKKIAHYILDTENDLRKLIAELREDFTCFTKWVDWKLLPENIKVDDGDLDASDYSLKYRLDIDKDCRESSGKCEVCSSKSVCPARFSNKRPAINFPSKASADYPNYPSYLSR